MEQQNMIETVTAHLRRQPQKVHALRQSARQLPAYDEMEYHPHQFVSMVENGRIEEADCARSGIYTVPELLWPAWSAVRETWSRQSSSRPCAMRAAPAGHESSEAAERIPEILDEELPQQAMAAAFRKYKK